ncbi:MAG: extracellular solute-binding protein [Pirellulales bacterium]
MDGKSGEELTGWVDRRAWLRGAVGGAMSGVMSGLVAGCRGAAANELVVYSALDREFAAPVLDDFTATTGVVVRASYDVESTKTVGLTQRLLAERERPRCSLFWNNEILNTLRLQRAGVLRPVKLVAAERFPESFRDLAGHWFGFAARARVLLVNTQRVAREEYPQRTEDLLATGWASRFGVAKPLFGTTATHAACLFAAWGEERAAAYWRGVLERGQVLAGNRQVARAVGAGQLDVGWTDTDDALAELAEGAPVEIIYPDQGEGDLGVLFIPNTVAAVSGGPGDELAERLMEYLLSAGVEARLARGASGQIPLARDVAERPPVSGPGQVRPWLVDFSQAADRWDSTATFLTDLLRRTA